MLISSSDGGGIGGVSALVSAGGGAAGGIDHASSATRSDGIDGALGDRRVPGRGQPGVDLGFGLLLLRRRLLRRRDDEADLRDHRVEHRDEDLVVVFATILSQPSAVTMPFGVPSPVSWMRRIHCVRSSLLRPSARTSVPLIEPLRAVIVSRNQRASNR